MAASVLALIRKRYDDIIKKNYQPQSEKGSAFGYANLDAAATIPPTSLPDLPASTILGRGSAGGAGPSETITLGGNLSMAGTVIDSTGGSGAPADAQYLVGAANVTLTAERVVTDTPTVAWDLATPAQAKADVRDESISNAKLRQSVARSVIGRAFFDAGSPADISAGVDGHVLRRAGVDIGFGLIPEASVTNLVTDLAARVPTSRLINTTAPIAGGGDLSLDRTISLNDNGVTDAKLRDSAASSVIGRAAASIGDPADIVAANDTVLGKQGAGSVAFSQVATAQVADNAITNAKAADMATARVKGRVTAGAGDPEDLTGTQVTTMLDVFTALLKGLVPLSGGGASNFLRADGAWAAPAGGSGFAALASQKFTAPGAFTYTPTPGMKACIVIWTGGGGGGGGADTLVGGSADVGVGGGGGGGGTAICWFSAAEIGVSQAVTVGASGGGGSTGGTNGTAGGTTSFGTFGSASGGSPGLGSGSTTQDAQSRAGGAGATTFGLTKADTLSVEGVVGAAGFAASSNTCTFGCGGGGGGSFWGSGAGAAAAAQVSLTVDLTASGSSSSAFGGGGGGAVDLTSTTGAPGGGGGAGVVFVLEFL